METKNATTITVATTIAAPIENVWKLWTEPEHIKKWNNASDDWHTPKAQNDLRKGGKFLIRMESKDGKMGFDFSGVYDNVKTNELISYTLDDGRKVKITFTSVGNNTKVEEAFEAESENSIDMQESGWQSILNNFKKYTELKQHTATLSKVGTYLNFSRNTEEAFNFYKSVFGGEFLGDIMRLGDAPVQEGMPPLAKEDKNLVMHIALPIMGNHLLMGTDAPESLGFKMNFGNNIHICLEPNTREETKRLFDALAKGGTVTMNLDDMFWGAYYGTVTDKFGVQWMFNYTNK
ncbi:MAG TPA: SRPBCC domain-containing protein [Bacteroidia bacterium]|nr:SRPBCC domain-containing protein [Bacteroidia bacterium]